jgi:hypothetical protein
MAIPMDQYHFRQWLHGHLKQTEEYVTRGEERLAYQRSPIAELEREGRDVTAAKAFFAQLEELQALNISPRNRLSVRPPRRGPSNI